MKKIVISDYDPEWADIFSNFKSCYEKLFLGIECNIQHVGSTSVKGLSAKPIIDMDIIVENDKDKKRVIQRLESVGYNHRGDLGIPGREAFGRTSENVPYCKEHTKVWPEHHLYCCLNGIESLENHLRLRDYLRRHPEAVREYSELKRALAERYPHDIDAYVEGKTDFIISILGKCGMTSDSLGDITKQNRKQE